VRDERNEKEKIIEIKGEKERNKRRQRKGNRKKMN
jgi:hypothetical protein